MNAWVLAKDLDRIAEAYEDDADLVELCRVLDDNYSYPVDSLVVRPDLRILGQLPVQKATMGGPRGYGKWLKKSRESDPDESLARHVFTPESPTASLLGVFKDDAVEYALDVSALPGAGSLQIDLRVSDGVVGGRFEVFADRRGEAIASHDVRAGARKSIEVEYAEGATLLLRVRTTRPLFGEAGAYLVDVTAK